MATSVTPTCVIIPTYNERDNIESLLDRVLAATDVDVLIVDDNSPDGTGELADDYAAKHDQVHVLHRQGKEGLCAAYVAGFRWALARDYAVICEMDADGSHSPEELPKLLHRIAEGADVVIGSRYVPGGQVRNWPKQRFLLSKAGNIYASMMLGAEIADITAGYRAYRREVLASIDLDSLSRAGYIFQVDLARQAVAAGFDVREVPITFVERVHGESKLDGSFVTSSLKEVTVWGLQHRFEQLKEFTAVSADLVKHEASSFVAKKRRQRRRKAQ
ncbi:polyprenol monophosphomannose synthase [Corynebacterium choanae]|uniref:dolichyl-phosphate beta-D-mannosyltransferase n=1 Tax=Corynebacterium choanae TaxID=1862358 RepID=A0A3G6JBM0_9CORY|nr:polyprenol monophosphomannose synthase [Corynebacterium choanae]AZA13544.1 Undecaprenyl-phosphate mannosyltransferase [Corynebacterium choanae]